MNGGSPLLRVVSLSKSFGMVEALSGVNFELNSGEVLGVVGQRGAGKSTLFRLLSGLFPPSEGEIYFEGKRLHLKAAFQAQQLGIEAVQQNPPLAENLDVLHNIFLGRELCHVDRLKLGIQEGEMAKVARSFFARFDLPAELIQQKPANLSNELKQMVAIVHALARPCKLLLLDDALAALSFQRQQVLLEIIQELAGKGVAVIISSDDLKHIFAVTHRILVLYQGRQVALKNTSTTTPRDIVELIVGSNRQEHVTPVIWAFENYHTAQQQAEELRRNQQALRQSLKAQDSLNRQLIERLRVQLEALDRLNLALQEANRRLFTEREMERKALARELHDQVIQDLLSFSYQLEQTATELDGREEEREALDEVRNGIRDVVGTLRQICSDLRPPTIDSHGLAAAIRSLVYQWKKQTGIEVILEIDPEFPRFPEHFELSIFRIVQEGLSNIRKHANASQAHLLLSGTPSANLRLELSDNGKGMDTPPDLALLSEQRHFGLVGVSERVSLLGGTMRLEKSKLGGLKLMIEIPTPYPVTQP